MVDKRNANRVSLGKTKKYDHLEDIEIDGSII
jgi:hypothetical protein